MVTHESAEPTHSMPVLCRGSRQVIATYRYAPEIKSIGDVQLHCTHLGSSRRSPRGELGTLGAQQRSHGPAQLFLEDAVLVTVVDDPHALQVVSVPQQQPAVPSTRRYHGLQQDTAEKRSAGRLMVLQLY